MKPSRLIPLLAALAFAVPAAAAPVVANVRAAQRPGTHLVDIYYDATDAAGLPLTVTVLVSADGGAGRGALLPAAAGAVKAQPPPRAGSRHGHRNWNRDQTALLAPVRRVGDEPNSFHTRSVSVTPQAWASQPRGVCGASPSTISGIWPRQPSVISRSTLPR